MPSGKPYDWQLPDRENPEIVALPPQALAQRVFERSAAFSEVRDPLVVTDDVHSGTDSDFLGVELDVLGRALLEMQRRGMVSPCEDGNLRLDDLAAIDRLSCGSHTSV